MTTRPPSALRTPPPSLGCTGDACTARDPWPLHHVKHRDVYCRLCTSCVLKYHPSQFCSLCYDLISNSNSNVPKLINAINSIINCSSCHNVCHSSCLPPCSSSSSTDFFLCPSCSTNPDAKIGERDNRRRIIDEVYARSLLCAARLAALSMNRAAIASRAEAEKKVKDAIAARKRAREMIESVQVVAKREEREVVAKREERESKIAIEILESVQAAAKREKERESKRAKEMLESVPAVAKREERESNKVVGDNKLIRYYDMGNKRGGEGNNNYEGNGGLERKIAPLNSIVGKVEEHLEAKDMIAIANKPIAVLPPPSKSEGNQNLTPSV